jgi:gamma-glutamyl:cysteine ligase YbdK (ATP-grasp superfamily)
LPELVALPANSPFFEGAESGLASTRLKSTRICRARGFPPAFVSWRELAEFLVDGCRLSENRWRALRDGLDGTLIDPDTGVVEPTRERVARLLVELEPHAEALDCAHEFAAAWALLEANGATRQRRVAARDGLDGPLD